jgi:hypothetical protein
MGCCWNTESFQSFDSLEGYFSQQRSTPGEINEHMDAVRALASQCDHVTDMGFRAGFSTPALLAGAPRRMVTYLAGPVVDRLMADSIRGRTILQPKQGDDEPPATIERTDLLFLDDPSGGQFWRQLETYAPFVSKWIVRPGTTAQPKLQADLRKFLAAHPEWFVWKSWEHQGGMVALSRRDEDRPALPGVLVMTANFLKAAARHAAGGFQIVPLEVLQQRQAACMTCPARLGDRCSLCGCPLTEGYRGENTGKLSWSTEACPLGHWSEHSTNP